MSNTSNCNLNFNIIIKWYLDIYNTPTIITIIIAAHIDNNIISIVRSHDILNVHRGRIYIHITRSMQHNLVFYNEIVHCSEAIE